MGLDMYLFASTYIGNWNFSKADEKAKYRKITKALGLNDEDFAHMTGSGQSVELMVKVAYWRKANAIHNWFVQVCQKGVDECQLAYVEREQLVQLVQLCKGVLGTVETIDGNLHNGTTYHSDGTVEDNFEPGKIVAQSGIAEKILPTQEGFFFGNTDYNEYYLDDLKETVSQLEAVLNNTKFNDWSFRYQSSW